jgi:lysophospholipase L1-like esterase
VLQRCFLLIAACAAAVSCLALLPAGPAQGAAWPPWGTPLPGSGYAAFLHLPGSIQPGPAQPGAVQPGSGQPGPAQPGSGQPGAVRPGARAAGLLGGCEQRLERGQRQAGAHVPALAIAGASFTAGVGPGNPGRSWAVLLTHLLHWNAVVYGDPGAGYVRAGVGRKGPVAAELARIGLRALAPALVIVQAGHDDIGVPLTLERQRVAAAIATIRAEAPRARIALLTVFPGRRHAAAALRTDQAIVAAGQAADHQVIIMDPLTGKWAFTRSPDGLHPTAGGSVWIARKVAGILAAHGIRPRPARPGTASITVCDSGIPGPRPPRSPR